VSLCSLIVQSDRPSSNHSLPPVIEAAPRHIAIGPVPLTSSNLIGGESPNGTLILTDCGVSSPPSALIRRLAWWRRPRHHLHHRGSTTCHPRRCSDSKTTLFHGRIARCGLDREWLLNRLDRGGRGCKLMSMRGRVFVVGAIAATCSLAHRPNESARQPRPMGNTIGLIHHTGKVVSLI
jgi:hypothetical protein